MASVNWWNISNCQTQQTSFWLIAANVICVSFPPWPGHGLLSTQIVALQLMMSESGQWMEVIEWCQQLLLQCSSINTVSSLNITGHNNIPTHCVLVSETLLIITMAWPGLAPPVVITSKNADISPLCHVTVSQDSKDQCRAESWLLQSEWPVVWLTCRLMLTLQMPTIVA